MAEFLNTGYPERKECGLGTELNSMGKDCKGPLDLTGQSTKPTTCSVPVSPSTASTYNNDVFVSRRKEEPLCNHHGVSTPLPVGLEIFIEIEYV